MNHADITQMIPGFQDPAKQPAILKQLAEYAASMGYKPEEMKDIRDRRHLLMVFKAMMFDRLISSELVNKQ